MVFAKAGLTEVIKHLYYYQLCAYIQQTILKCPAFANTQTVIANATTKLLATFHLQNKF